MGNTSQLVRLRDLAIEYADAGLSHNEIYEKLEANYSDAVDEFILTQRRGLVMQAIREIVGQKRRQRVHLARFGAAKDRVAAGEQVLLASFTVADGGRKNLVNMLKEDWVFSAREDEQQAGIRLSQARMKRAIARKVPQGKLTGDVFSPEQIANFYRRFDVEVEEAT